MDKYCTWSIQQKFSGRADMGESAATGMEMGKEMQAKSEANLQRFHSGVSFNLCSKAILQENMGDACLTERRYLNITPFNHFFTPAERRKYRN